MVIGVILAGGKSTRFKSDLPKGLHKIDGKSIVERLLDCFDMCGMGKKYIVVSEDSYCHYKNVKNVDFVFQDKTLFGTGGAFYSINGLFNQDDDIVVVNSDCFLFEKDIILKFYNAFLMNDFDLGLITMKVGDSSGYGRVIEKNNIIKIIEEKDADELVKKINLVNSGVYVFKGKYLQKNIKRLNVVNDESKITILFDGISCFNYISNSLIRSINNKREFSEVNKEFYRFICNKHVFNGVKIYDVSSTYIGENVIIGNDVEIFPNCYVLGNTVVKDRTIIYPFSIINDSVIGDSNLIGPFAHIKNNTITSSNVVLGAFVEVKNSVLDGNVKAKHHAYFGNCLIGENSNIGCGFVSANYDGKNKNETRIGSNCFIGSNVTIVAPVTVGDNVVIGAGSTITDDVSSNSLSIARVRQINKEGYTS